MTWAIREELTKLEAELPIEVLQKVDLAVEFLQELGQSHATRAHVVEFAIESQLASGAKAYVAFRRWRRLRDEGGEMEEQEK